MRGLGAAAAYCLAQRRLLFHSAKRWPAHPSCSLRSRIYVLPSFTIPLGTMFQKGTARPALVASDHVAKDAVIPIALEIDARPLTCSNPLQHMRPLLWDSPPDVPAQLAQSGSSARCLLRVQDRPQRAHGFGRSPLHRMGSTSSRWRSVGPRKGGRRLQNLGGAGRRRWTKALAQVRGRVLDLKRQARLRQAQLRRLRLRAVETSATATRGFRALWNKYGYIGLGTYFGVYFLTLSSFFLATSSGILTGDQVNAWAEQLHLQNHIDIRKLEKVDSVWGRALVAWIATKLVEPLRLFVTVTITPTVAKHIRKVFRR